MADAGAALKRRKLRKGTHSCWECKHRKIRCEFKHATDSRCDSCHRHGLSCVSQEFEETPKHDSHEYPEYDLEEVADSIDRVEALVIQLATQKSLRRFQGSVAKSSVNKRKTPSTYSGTSVIGNNGVIVRQPQRIAAINFGLSPLSLLTTAGQDMPSRCNSLSQYLISVLPHPNTAAIISIRGKLPHEVLRQPLEKLQISRASTKRTAQASRVSPALAARPVLLARKLLRLALCLQHLNGKKQEHPELRLDEPVGELARRYVDAAHFVTSQDSLLTSLEGIETLMLEGFFEINACNLRSTWLIFRRAIGIAQLMGFPGENYHRSRAEFLWFKLLYVDRHLSLVLGLPHTVADDSFANENILADDTPSGRLDRIHVKVTGQIIDRNVHLQQATNKNSKNVYDSYRDTQAIERELQKAAGYFLGDFSALSAIRDLSSEEEALENTKKVISQLYHHSLLVHLEMPYLIQSLQEISTRSTYAHPSSRTEHGYNKTAILNASREVLSHYLLFRDLHQSRVSYPGLENKGFIASIMLLFARVDNYYHNGGEISGQQRAMDLKAVNDIAGIMENVGCAESLEHFFCDPAVMRKLVDIEANAKRGIRYVFCIDEEYDEDSSSENGDVDDVLSFSLAFVGTIRIMSRKEPPRIFERSSTTDSSLSWESQIDELEQEINTKESSYSTAYPPMSNSVADIESLLRHSDTIDSNIPFAQEFQAQHNTYPGFEQPSLFSTSMLLQAASWAGPGMDSQGLPEGGANSGFFNV